MIQVVIIYQEIVGETNSPGDLTIKTANYEIVWINRATTSLTLLSFSLRLFMRLCTLKAGFANLTPRGPVPLLLVDAPEELSSLEDELLLLDTSLLLTDL